MNRYSRAILAGIALALIPLVATGAPRHAAPPMGAVVRASQVTGHLTVPADQSRLLRIERPFQEINVGNKDIAEVLPLSNNQVYVLGKKNGTTNLTIRDAAGDVVAVVDVFVTYDVDALSRRLRLLLPGDVIQVTPSGDAVVLSGVVPSPDDIRQALRVAESYAPGKVVNMMSLTGTQQVLIEVKFAEVERSALKQLGISTLFQYTGGADAITSTVAADSPMAPLGSVLGAFNHGNFNLKAQLDALQKDGLIRTLAEPNLVALSGDTASFLAGGEVPIPVAVQPAASSTGVTQVSLEYKKYGVGLSFTPTVVGARVVNLVIDSEVSSIDDTKAFKENGFDIPALKIRKAKTTVELQDGQSFAIAGLLQDNFTNGTSRYPGLGDVPVLGALFRSENFQHNQSDLVLIITLHLIRPTDGKRLQTPLDTAQPPTAAEHFETGNIESSAATPPRNAN